MGLSSVWYQINQQEARNFFDTTFPKVPLRRPIKDESCFHCYHNGTQCPTKANVQEHMYLEVNCMFLMNF